MPFTSEEDLLAFLTASGVAYSRFTHPAVYTCEEAAAWMPPEYIPTASMPVEYIPVANMPGAQLGEGWLPLATKNLFLRSERGGLFLLMTGCDRRVNFKVLARALGAGRVQLASPELMHEALGLTPGAVTVLALVNDPAGRVRLLVDEELWPAPAYLCHPLVNTSTLMLAHAALLRFLAITAHAAQAVPVTAAR